MGELRTKERTKGGRVHVGHQDDFRSKSEKSYLSVYPDEPRGSGGDIALQNKMLHNPVVRKRVDIIVERRGDLYLNRIVAGTEKPAETGEEAPAGRRSIPGSVSWVPASAGLRLAEHVVLSLVGLQSGSSVIQ